MAPFIALFYIFVIIALLSSPDKVFDYMTEHKDVLFLNDAQIETIRRLVPVWCIVLACLAAIELSRYVSDHLQYDFSVMRQTLFCIHLPYIIPSLHCTGL